MKPPKPNIIGQQELILKSSSVVGKAAIQAAFVNYSEVSKEQGDASIGAVAYELKKSKFGMPIFDAFSFNCTNSTPIRYTASSEFGSGEVLLNAPFTFETSLIELNQTKNIVRTVIAGTNGSVKEFMSEGDFIINLKGVIVGDVANQRPDVILVDKLIQYLKAPLALPVYCTFLNEFNINSVVIESYKYGQREGARNVIDIEINMLSDSPIELSVSANQRDVFTQRSMF